MRSTERKTIKEWQSRASEALSQLEDLKSQLEDIKQEHEDWMNERDYDTDGKFLDSPTGERAQEEFDNIEDWFDRLDTVISDFGDILNDIDEI